MPPIVPPIAAPAAKEFMKRGIASASVIFPAPAIIRASCPASVRPSMTAPTPKPFTPRESLPPLVSLLDILSVVSNPFLTDGLAPAFCSLNIWRLDGVLKNLPAKTNSGKVSRNA